MALEKKEGPQLGFDRLLSELVTQGTAIITTRSRLRELIAVNRELTSHLDLPTVLHRIVEIGAGLVGSRHAAMVVLGPDETARRYTHGGITDDQVTTIRTLSSDRRSPTGATRYTGPLHLGDAGAEDGASGPRDVDVLAVPIMVRGTQFGDLYLVDAEAGDFSADDEELAVALADSASIAIENARLYEDSQHRERVATSMVTLSRQMSRSDDDPVDALLTEVRQHFDADMINVTMIDEHRSHLYVERVQGHGEEAVGRGSYPIAGSPMRETMMANENRVTLVDDISAERSPGFAELEELGPLLAAPFVVEKKTAGFLCVVRVRGREQFGDRDVRTAEAFATQLSVIYERRRARASQRRLELLEDRERIARDLHDHVIQRLFAIGLQLQAVTADLAPPTLDVVDRQIDEVDGAIVQIRQSIFAIRASERPLGGEGLRARLIEVLERLSLQGLRPTLTFQGPVDGLADPELGHDVVAVVSEGLANALRYARASSIDIVVEVRDGRFQVEVVDDGQGISPDAGRRGLENLRARAERRGGDLTVASSPADGTRLTWTVPLSPAGLG